MLYWWRKKARPEGKDEDLAFNAELLAERLHRIAAEHTPVPGATYLPPPPPVPILLLPAPDYRREFIGRYDWGRKTMFPFDG